MLEPTDRKAIERRLAAIVRAAGKDDPEHLADVVALLQEALAVYVPAAVTELRQPQGEAPGYSWADIARPLGITRQTAHERFTR